MIVVEIIYYLRTMELKCGGNGERMEHLGWGVLVKGRGVSEMYIMRISVTALCFSIFLITVISSSLYSIFHHEHAGIESTTMPHKTSTFPPISFSFNAPTQINPKSTLYSHSPQLSSSNKHTTPPSLLPPPLPIVIKYLCSRYKHPLLLHTTLPRLNRPISHLILQRLHYPSIHHHTHYTIALIVESARLQSSPSVPQEATFHLYLATPF